MLFSHVTIVWKFKCEFKSHIE